MSNLPLALSVAAALLLAPGFQGAAQAQAPPFNRGAHRILSVNQEAAIRRLCGLSPTSVQAQGKPQIARCSDKRGNS